MAKKTEDFDFDEFMLDDVAEDTSQEKEDKEPEGVFSCEEDYDKILDLASDDHQLAIDAKYPYLRVSGFMNVENIVTKEVEMLANRLARLEESIAGKVKEEDRIDVAFNILGEEYVVNKLPLTLDTILTIIAPHRYCVEVVSGENQSFEISGTMLKGLMFT